MPIRAYFLGVIHVINIHNKVVLILTVFHPFFIIYPLQIKQPLLIRQGNTTNGLVILYRVDNPDTGAFLCHLGPGEVLRLWRESRRNSMAILYLRSRRGYLGKSFSLSV